MSLSSMRMLVCLQQGDGFACNAGQYAMLRNLRKAKGLPEDQWSSGSIEPEKSAQGILALINKLDLSNSGSYWAADSGDTIPW